jgi:hypothetical protein
MGRITEIISRRDVEEGMGCGTGFDFRGDALGSFKGDVSF